MIDITRRIRVQRAMHFLVEMRWFLWSGLYLVRPRGQPFQIGSCPSSPDRSDSYRLAVDSRQSQNSMHSFCDCAMRHRLRHIGRPLPTRVLALDVLLNCYGICIHVRNGLKTELSSSRPYSAVPAARPRWTPIAQTWDRR